MDVIKKFLLFCFFLNFSFFFGQEKTDLSQLSYESLNDTVAKYIFNDLFKAVEASNKYIAKAKNENDKKKEWQGMNLLGKSYERHQEFDKAQEQFEKSLELAQANNFKEEVIGSYALGASVQLGLSNASKALDLLDDALSLAEEIESDYWKEYVLQFVAYILQMSGDYQKVIEIRKQAILIYKNKPIDSTFSSSIKNENLVYRYSQLSGSFLKNKQADSAKHYANLISKLIIKEDDCGQRILYQTQSEIYYFEKKYTDAKQKLLAASKICDPNSQLENLRINGDLGKIALAQENFQEAIDYLQKGLDDYDVKPSEEGFMDNYYKLLADSYKGVGNYEKANYYFEK